MSLPQELADKICSYLAPEDLKTAYYISTMFRKAAEEHAKKYRTREIWMTDDNQRDFVKNYSGFRLRFVERILYEPHFSNVVLEEDSPCRETAEEVYDKDTIFTAQVKRLFTTLKKAEDIAGSRNRGKYELGIYHPKQALVGKVCFHREHDLWRVHLLEHKTLPDLMSVFSFELLNHDRQEHRTKLDYRVVVDCIAHFPNVEKVTWNTGHDEWTPEHPIPPGDRVLWEYAGPRRDTRHGLSKAITSAKIAGSLRTLQLDFFYHNRESGGERPEDIIDQTKPMPNLVLPEINDPFSTSLRVLTYHLRTLILRVQADKSLFWPEDGSSPTWPNLEELSIMFHMVTPYGTWYFEGPRGEGRTSIGYELSDEAYPPLEVTEDDYDDHYEVEENICAFETGYDFQFRVSPNDDVLRQFLESFAKAANKMPKLKYAVLWSPLRWEVNGLNSEPDRYGYEDFEYFDETELNANLSHGSALHHELVWGLAYTMPRYPEAFYIHPGEANCEARQMWWSTGKWRPDPSLHAMIQMIGHREHGDALKEYWDDEFRPGIPRWSFEDWTWPF